MEDEKTDDEKAERNGEKKQNIDQIFIKKQKDRNKNVNH